MTQQEQIALIKKNPITVGCGALALLLGLGVYFRGGEIPAAEAELAQKSDEGERLALNITNSAQLKEQYDDLVAANKVIDAGIIRASQQGMSSQYFYKLEADSGVKIVDFRQTTPSTVAKPAKSTYVPIAFNVSAQGSLTQLIQFLHLLENGSHYTRSLTASVSSNTTTRQNPLTLGLTLEILGLP